MENRSHLLRALKVLFPNKSSYRIKQSDIPLILYSFECYRRGIKEVRLTTWKILLTRYFKPGRKNVLQLNNKVIAWNSIVPLTYMTGYLKKKYQIKNNVDLFLLALALDIEPTLFLIAYKKFRGNNRLQKLSAKEIAEEWKTVYRDAKLFLTSEKLEKTVEVIKEKKGEDWKRLFIKMNKNLAKISNSELAAGLTYHFYTKEKKQKGLYRLSEDEIFKFDTFFQMIAKGFFYPINLKQVKYPTPTEITEETYQVTAFIMKNSQDIGLELTNLVLYYTIVNNLPPEIKKFFDRIDDEKDFDKRRNIWKFIYAKEKLKGTNLKNHSSKLPTEIVSFLSKRIEKVYSAIKNLKKITIETV